MRESGVAPNRRNVGGGFRHIARLERQRIIFRRAPERVLEHRDEVEQGLGMVVADVVEPVGRLAVVRQSKTRSTPSTISSK